MENLVFCLNATIPIFLTLMLGLFFRRIGLFDDIFVSRLNKFVFNAALPALLFLDIAKSDFYSVWNTKFVLFCFFVTLISIGISTGLSYLLKPRNIQGEFIQASYRSSAAIDHKRSHSGVSVEILDNGNTKDRSSEACLFTISWPSQHFLSSLPAVESLIRQNLSKL